MPSAYIAMGQGVIFVGDIELFTEALLSCTFIGAYNENTGVVGAFHYPSGTMNSVRAVMDQWMNDIAPTEIVLVFARPTHGYSYQPGTTALEREGLARWSQRWTHNVTTTEATAGRVAVSDGELEGGDVPRGAGFDPESGDDLVPLDAGAHGSYRLYDARPYIRSDSPGAQEEARSGRRRGRRSWLSRLGNLFRRRRR